MATFLHPYVKRFKDIFDNSYKDEVEPPPLPAKSYYVIE